MDAALVPAMLSFVNTQTESILLAVYYLVESMIHQRIWMSA